MKFERTMYIASVPVLDPDSKLWVHVEIRKCQDSGAMVGIDESFLEDTDKLVRNPYNRGYLTTESDYKSREDCDKPDDNQPPEDLTCSTS
jgi:hypothetical protein